MTIGSHTKAFAVCLVGAMLGSCASQAPSSESVRDETSAIVIAQGRQCMLPPIPNASWHARLHPDGWYTWYGDDPPHAPALFIFVSQQDGRAGHCYYVVAADPDSIDIGTAPGSTR